MDTIQVALFFVVSYLLSRVFVSLKIPELVVYYLFEKRHVSIQKLTLILISGTAAISTVIANMITVLTLMPLVIILQKEIHVEEKLRTKLNTLLLLSVLWGANIGGVGMVTGTTTNGILIGMYEFYKIPVARDFTFLSWAVWGIPLTFTLVVLGWTILMLVFKPGNIMHKSDISSELQSTGLSRQLQKTGFKLAGVFIITASVLSYLLSIFQKHGLVIIFITLLWTIMFICLLMVYKWRTEDGSKRRLLLWKDTLQDVPKRGLFWIGLAILLSYILWRVGFHTVIKDWFTVWLGGSHSIILLYLILALLATFASELISNTAVLFTMLMVLFPMMKTNPDISWQGMLIIALCSSCAFMSPLATPSNGLGFGSSRKISIKYMLLAGFIMNLVCTCIIVTWVHVVVPMTLSWFF